MDQISDPLIGEKPQYLNAQAAGRPLKNPISHETLVRARGYRQQRIRQKLAEHDVAALLCFDPLNIRYATDCSDMQVWILHNAARYAMIVNDGPAICFEYRNAMHLAENLETVDEVRPATSWFYFASGPRTMEMAAEWADEIADILREHGGGNMRLAVDKMEPMGVDILRQRGVEIVEGQEITETARMIKSSDEIEIMNWTIKVCEAGMWRMRDLSEPGRTENEIWAELHHENIRNGGEWVETRLLAIGARTNPWFQESSDHVGQLGDLLSFDTDLVGPYGYCCDISRSWTIGHTPPSDEQKRLYAHAYNQIEHNKNIIQPGMTFGEISEVIPFIEVAYDCGIDLNGPQKFAPRAFKTHLSADELPSNPRFIVVLRDPMDACVSFFNFMNGWYLEPGTVSLETFTQDCFFEWSGGERYWTHLCSWWSRRGNDNVRIFCFEDIKKDPADCVRTVAEFIGIELDDELEQLVLKQSSIDFMLRHKHQFDDNLLRRARDAAIGLPPDGESSKVKSGKVGASKALLPDHILTRFDEIWREEVAPLTGAQSYQDLRALV